MTARLNSFVHPDSAQARTDAAISRVVLQIGVTEVSRLIKVDHGTVSRRLSGTAWPNHDVIALKRVERDLLQSRTIHDAETEALYGAEVADALAAVQHVTATMGVHGEIVALEAQILADGNINSSDRANIDILKIKVNAAHLSDLRAIASIEARLGEGR